MLNIADFRSIQRNALERSARPWKVLKATEAVEGAGHGRGFPTRINDLIKTFLAHHLIGEEKTVSEETLASAP